MTDKEAVEAVHRAIADATDWWVGPHIARIALQAARPFLLEEAARIAETAVYKRKALICGCSEGLANYTAAAIRAAKETSE